MHPHPAHLYLALQGWSQTVFSPRSKSALSHSALTNNHVLYTTSSLMWGWQAMWLPANAKTRFMVRLGGVHQPLTITTVGWQGRHLKQRLRVRLRRPLEAMPIKSMLDAGMVMEGRGCPHHKIGRRLRQIRRAAPARLCSIQEDMPARSASEAAIVLGVHLHAIAAAAV